jgi:hypothetical protein
VESPTTEVPVEAPESAAFQRFARSYGVTAGSVLGGLLLSGGLLRVNALRPHSVLGVSLARDVSSLHGALTLAAIPLFLLHVTPMRPSDHGLRALVAAGYCVGGGLFVSGSQEEEWGVSMMAALLVMLAATAVLGWLILASQPRWPTGWFLAVAASSSAVGWLGLLVGAPGAMAMALFPVVLTVLVLPLFALRARGEPVAGPVFVGATCCYLLCTAAARYWVFASGLAFPAWVAALVVSVHVYRAGRLESTLWSGWLRRIEALLFAGGSTLAMLLHLIDADTHLGDTLFPVAARHLEAFVLVFALLRALDREYVSRLQWSGLILAALGAHVFSYGCMLLGTRGMPRRYVAYLDRFTTLQVVASVGALVLLAGLLIIVLARGEAIRKQLHSR